MLHKTLKSTALTAHSATSGEIEIRKGEAGLVLQWIERARSIVVKSQLVPGAYAGAAETIIENGDVINAPSVSNLVMIIGEVPVSLMRVTTLARLTDIDLYGGPPWHGCPG